MLQALRRNILPILLISLVSVLALYPVSFFMYTMKWDILDQFFPCRYFIGECFKNGQLPLWNPYINFGYPFHADPQGGMFYPVTWLIASTTGYSVYTIAAEYILHVAIAGIAFFYLLKSFGLKNVTAITFGITYCLSGLFIANAQHLTWAVTLAWLPFVIMFFQKLLNKPAAVHAIALALFTSLSLTGGYIGFFIVLAYFFAAYGVYYVFSEWRHKEGAYFKNLLVYTALAAFVFLLLSGGFLYSFIESLPYIARGKPVSITEVNNVPLSPQAMVSFFFPFVLACKQYVLNTDPSMANVYCGLLMLPLCLLAILSRKLNRLAVSLLIFSIICFAAAMGKYFFVRSVLYNYLPGMNMLRHAAIFRVFTVFGLILISAIGFNIFTSGDNALGRKSRFAFVAYTVAITILLSVILVKHQLVTLLPQGLSMASIVAFNTTASGYQHLLFQGGIQLAFLSLITFIIFRKRNSTYANIIALLLVADISISAMLNLPATVISEEKPHVLQAKLKTYPKGFPIPEQSMETYTHYSDGSTPPIWYNLSFFKKIPAKDGFNSFYMNNVDDFNASVNQAKWLSKPVAWFSNPSIKYDITAFEPGNIAINYSAANADTLHIAQNSYNGWMMITDGRSKNVINNNKGFIEAPVPAAQHTILLKYQRNDITVLFFIAVGSIVLSILYLLWKLRLTNSSSIS